MSDVPKLANAYPLVYAFIIGLGDTPEERQRALGVSERTYYHYMSGRFPLRAVAPLLVERDGQRLVDALCSDLTQMSMAGDAE